MTLEELEETLMRFLVGLNYVPADLNASDIDRDIFEADMASDGLIVRLGPLLIGICDTTGERDMEVDM